MSLDKGPIGPVSSVSLAPISLSGPNTVRVTSSQPEVFSLPVAFQPEVSSDPASCVSLATLLVVLTRAASSLGRITPLLSGVVKIGFTSTNAASPSCGSLQYLQKRLAQRDAEFVKLNNEYIQREKFATFLKGRLSHMESQLAASRSDCDALRVANGDLLKSQETGREELSILRALVSELEADLQAPRASPFDLADAVRDQDFCKVLLQPLAAQVQGLQVVYAGVVHIAVKLFFKMALVCC